VSGDSTAIPSTGPTSTGPTSAPPRLRWPLATILANRGIANTFIRFPYVLITPLTLGLGISLSTATALLGIRELGGLLAPIAGRQADRGHERSTMVICGLLTAAGSAFATLGSNVVIFCVMMTIGGAAKIGSDSAQSAWVGHRVPFHGRGRILGLTELSWGGAFLVGVPACAWLTNDFGWQAPYIILGGAIALSSVALRIVAPRDEIIAVEDRRTGRWHPPRSSWGLFAYAFLQPFAQMMVFAVAGDWFVTAFGLSLSGLGTGALLIGVGEIVGTLATVWAADHFGKKPSTIAGLVPVIPALLVLAWVGDNQILGVGLIVVGAIGFEFSFVSALPLFTEIDPSARASAVSATFAMATLSRAISSALAGVIYVWGGIAANGAVAAFCLILGAVIVAFGVSEPGSSRVSRRRALPIDPN